MFIGEIIKEYRTSYNISQRDFASRTSLSHSYINTLEKVFNPKTGKPYSVTTDVAKELANAMSMSIEELLYKLDESQEFEVNSNDPNNIIPIQFDRSHIIRVPIYGTIPAGIPFEAIEDIIDYVELTVKANDKRDYFGLEIRGNSMYPDYKDKDYVIFIKQPDCNSGQDCAVMVNGDDATFKKVLKQESGILLQPMNPEYNPTFYTNKDITQRPVIILGIACQIIRKIDCDN